MSDQVNLKDKNQYLNEMLGNDISDMAENLRLETYAALPDMQVKNQVWAEITVQKGSSFSNKQLESKMGTYNDFE